MARRLSVILTLLGLLLALAVTPALGDLGTQSNLTAITGQGSGFIALAPTAHDVVGPDTFDVQGTVNVHNAAPNTTFAVLRRVDLNPDGICTGVAWVALPPPNTPVLTTSAGGAGALHFENSPPGPLVDGVQFDVQWRLEGSDGSVLESDCLTITVK
jgi:hypothetical protein